MWLVSGETKISTLEDWTRLRALVHCLCQMPQLHLGVKEVACASKRPGWAADLTGGHSCPSTLSADEHADETAGGSQLL
jgi:hypothetical protein